MCFVHSKSFKSVPVSFSLANICILYIVKSRNGINFLLFEYNDFSDNINLSNKDAIQMHNDIHQQTITSIGKWCRCLHFYHMHQWQFCRKENLYHSTTKTKQTAGDRPFLFHGVFKTCATRIHIFTQKGIHIVKLFPRLLSRFGILFYFLFKKIHGQRVIFIFNV